MSYDSDKDIGVFTMFPAVLSWLFSRRDVRFAPARQNFTRIGFVALPGLRISRGTLPAPRLYALFENSQANRWRHIVKFSSPS